MKTIQYTLRSVPNAVNQMLRQAAQLNRCSLNAMAIKALTHGLGMDQEPNDYHDLDDLAGTWVADPAFDETVRALDRVNPELWK